MFLTSEGTLYTGWTRCGTRRYQADPLVQFSAYEQLLRRNVKRFRGGLVFKAHILLNHSTLGSTVIKEKKESTLVPRLQALRSKIIIGQGSYVGSTVAGTQKDTLE